MSSQIAVVDARPFFEKALRFGLEQGILERGCLERIEADAPKGIVQIADHFGTAYLRTDLESATLRLVNLISLYLEDFANGDLRTAAMSLRDNSLLSHSRGGSEMLKRLHAMPRDTGLHARKADPVAQKIFVNERSFAFPLTVEAYRAQVAQCQANQLRIDFARWLARRLATPPEEYEDYSADELIRSAMLVLCVGTQPAAMPTKTAFVGLVTALRKKNFKPAAAAFEAFLEAAPDAFAAMARQSMQEFRATLLPRLKAAGQSADEILHAESQGAFFVRETPEADIAAYDTLVAREWVRLTRGNADDPAVLATLFLNLATGHPPKAAALLKEAKAIIAAYRSKGFDSPAVLAFIDAHAPFEQREGLRQLWLQDLLPEAEIHLADNDPQMPDSHMDRALAYFRKTCVTTWKGSGR